MKKSVIKTVDFYRKKRNKSWYFIVNIYIIDMSSIQIFFEKSDI